MVKGINFLKYKISKTKLGSQIFCPPLKSIDLELTNSCNFSCKMCFFRNKSVKRKIGFMSSSFFNRLILELSEKNRNSNIGLNFSGESLLHPNFSKMVFCLIKNGFRNLGLSTNGSLIHLNLDGVSQIKDVRISIDGFKETHEKVRAGANYEKIVDNVFRLTNLSGERGCSLNLVKGFQNEDEIKEFVNFWVNKVDYVAISEQLDSNLKLVTTNEDIEKVLDGDRQICLFPWRYMAVLWDGSVTLCCHDLSGDLLLDSNLRVMNIESVWASSEYKYIRRSHQKLDFSNLHLCETCDAWAGDHVTPKVSKLGNVYVVRYGLCTYYSRRFQPILNWKRLLYYS